jgi:hypothetical protein
VVRSLLLGGLLVILEISMSTTSSSRRTIFVCLSSEDRSLVCQKTSPTSYLKHNLSLCLSSVEAFMSWSCESLVVEGERVL